ncbi:MAG TPA: GMC family oxidoreductase N-terminal domain-containing protein [Steroidobacteraceae bacterium]|nr:GMC family oxidoreductase N-terminal domain-containing protein [Steroidobacteraceae bacterium]
MAESQFDYVIVGAGSAGCVLANRLTSEPRTRVLLLEAGGDDRPLHNPGQLWSNLMIQTPIGFGRTLNDPKVNWLYETEPDSHGRVHKWPKGKVLGGSSSINGLLYIRGQHADFDGWRDAGCEGWSFAEVLPYFRRAEHQERGESEWHGVGGPLNVSDFTRQHPLSGAMLEACVEAGIPRSPDINAAEQEGVTWFQLTIKKGRRCSAAVGYLHPAMSRPNLRVEKHALALRVLFEGRRATGIEYLQHGTRHVARARAEVILAAGSVASPQLLEVSGIGRGALLQQHGIPVLAELPAVGENLQDHYMIGAQWRVKPEYTTVNELSHGARFAGELLKYLFTRQGLLSFAVAHIVAFCRSNRELTRPDLQLHLMAASMDLEQLAKTQALILEKKPGMTCTPCQIRPESRGTVHIKSADASVYPSIVPNYLSHPTDQQVAIAGMRLTRRVMNQPALAPYLESAADHFGDTDESMLAYARVAGNTLYHPVGTCRMGGDRQAVVDAQLRVQGIERLRVVDASIMPRITSGNTNAATIMIAEKAADMILGKPPASPARQSARAPAAERATLDA